MTHRKVYSQGNIPFSWEDRPGISKVTTNQECLIDHRAQTLDSTSSILSSSPSKQQSKSPLSTTNDQFKIPPPPCASQPPSRSSSGRGLRWQEDPFLLAYKECTKPPKKRKDQGNKRCAKVKKSLFMYFSCKNASCDVRSDNFVKPIQLPPLPRRRHENFVMENW